MEKKVICFGETWKVSELGFITSDKGSDLCRLSEVGKDPVFVPYIPQGYMGAKKEDWNDFRSFAKERKEA